MDHHGLTESLRKSHKPLIHPHQTTLFYTGKPRAKKRIHFIQFFHLLLKSPLSLPIKMRSCRQSQRTPAGTCGWKRRFDDSLR